MSDRYNALVVVLEKDMRDDDAQAIINSIRMIRGVLSVEPKVVDIQVHVAEMRARADLGQKILRVVYPELEITQKERLKV